MRYAPFFLLLTACSLFEPGPEPLSPGAVQFTPPAVYADYWHAIDSCSGRPRPMTTSFYKVNDVSLDPYGIVVGLYQPIADRITYSTTALASADIIRHEMLHAHLRGITDKSAHPVEYFGSQANSYTDGKCGGLVSH